ncbi:hypothetical protein Tco_1053518 [Tanacetum coccineum]|uniref:Uncharacterized protein n=1 Tax=Tanacetum coccineum TaxID=301880 RepID=A0ABQ5GU44_9ASTR
MGKMGIGFKVMDRVIEAIHGESGLECLQLKKKLFWIRVIKVYMAKMGKIGRRIQLVTVLWEAFIQGWNIEDKKNVTWSFRRVLEAEGNNNQLTVLTKYVDGVVLGVTPG